MPCAATARYAPAAPRRRLGAQSLHERDDLLRAAPADWAADPGLREDYRQHRPNVERAIAQVAARGGRRIKLRYRGTATNNTWLKRRTAAVNPPNRLLQRATARRR